MTHEELVEKVARSIVEATSGPWELISPEGQDAARLEAWVAVATIAEALKEPTGEMVHEGERSHCLVTYGMAHDCFVAMLSVSPLYPKGESNEG